MLCRYELTLAAICPVDQSTDYYAVVVESGAEIRCEKLVAFANTWRIHKATQEVITAAMAEAFPDATITTTGFHSGVRTVVTAP